MNHFTNMYICMYCLHYVDCRNELYYTYFVCIPEKFNTKTF